MRTRILPVLFLTAATVVLAATAISWMNPGTGADPSAADNLIRAGKAFNIDAKIVGRVEAAGKKSLTLKIGEEEIVY